MSHSLIVLIEGAGVVYIYQLFIRTNSMNMRYLILVLSLTTAEVSADNSTLYAAIGGGIGGAAGAAIGNKIGGRDGVIIGGALGEAVGAAITMDDNPKYMSAD